MKTNIEKARVVRMPADKPVEMKNPHEQFGQHTRDS